jgi:hypothetical protein
VNDSSKAGHQFVIQGLDSKQSGAFNVVLNRRLSRPSQYPQPRQ